MSDYQVKLESGAVRGLITFDFTPTLEDAPALLMGIAALIEKIPQSKEEDEESTYVAFKNKINDLQLKCTVLEQEKSALVQQLKSISSIPKTIPSIPVKEKTVTGTARINERVKIKPHGDYYNWHNGVVKGYKNHTSIVVVRPDNHGQDIEVPKKFIQRIKAEVQKAEVQKAQAQKVD